MSDAEEVPRPDNLLRLTTYGGTDLSELVARCEAEESSAKPVYIRPSASSEEGHLPSLLHPQVGQRQRHSIHVKPDLESGSTGEEEASSDPDEDSDVARHARRRNVQNAEEWAPGIPTKGSEGHQFGKCKPCAFVWKEDGCQSGIDCKFCHLCAPGEKKRRKKERHQVARVRVKDYNSSSPFVGGGGAPHYGTQRLIQPADSHYQNKASMMLAPPASSQYGRTKKQGDFTRKLYLDSLERSESLKQKQTFSSSSRTPLQPLLGVPPPFFPYEAVDPYVVPMPFPDPALDVGLHCYPVFQEAHARAAAAAAAAYQNEFAACARYETVAR